MLVQFTVQNFKSIKKPATLDLQATAFSEHRNTLLRSPAGDLLLPLSVIYGPNGGGKSNVLEAIGALVRKVVVPIYMATHTVGAMPGYPSAPIMPFVFDPHTKNEPSTFEVFFQTGLAEYRYCLHTKEEKVVYERLDRVKFSTKKQSGLFERDSNGLKMIGDFRSLKVTRDLSSTMPVLSFLGMTYENDEIVNDVLNWFKTKIAVIDYGKPQQELWVSIANSEQARKLVLSMMQEMDLDIVDYRTEERPNHTLAVFTKHRVGDSEIELSLNEESSGTQKIFGLLPQIAISLLQGSALVIDELDAKVHPLLLRYLIKLFRDPEINQHNSQLIFTSHDLTNMTNEVFRRDEIWFVAKGLDRGSVLYCLADFKTDNGKVRNDAVYAKQYLEGKYGADPYLQRIINWEDVGHATE